MNIAYFLSDHGFGHLMRNLPMMDELSSRGHNIILICGKKQCEFVSQHNKSINCISYHTDVGLILYPGTLIIDKNKTANEVHNSILSWSEKIEFGKNIIKKYNIDRVVIDIVPWAIESAKELNIPSIFMASFTWIEQYEGYVNIDDLEVLRNAFKKTSKNLFFGLINEPTMNLLKEGIDVGFVSRKFNEDNVNRIKQRHKRKIVFLSLGASNSGLDFEIDVSKLPYDFISTKAYKLIGDNVYYIDQNNNDTHDYIKAADICISKAGWTTVSEILISGTRCVLINRKDVVEDTMIIDKLIKKKLAISFDAEDLKNMDFILNNVENFKFNKQKFNNNVDFTSNIIESEL